MGKTALFFVDKIYKPMVYLVHQLILNKTNEMEESKMSRLKMRVGNIGRKGSATIGGISKGEREVQQVLYYHEVRYFRETCFNDCRGGIHNKTLPFDFSIYKDGKLVALIEYQGSQHFVDTFGMADYAKTIANDEIKRNYCKEKGIPLLEVPYWKFKEIDSLVVGFLRSNGILKKKVRR